MTTQTEMLLQLALQQWTLVGKGLTALIDDVRDIIKEERRDRASSGTSDNQA